jgi:hypothetical protein
MVVDGSHITLYVEFFPDLHRVFFSVLSTETVLGLKTQISRRFVVPISLQRLVFRGSVLRDPLSLQSYGVQSGSRLILVVRASTEVPDDGPSKSLSFGVSRATSAIARGHSWVELRAADLSLDRTFGQARSYHSGVERYKSFMESCEERAGRNGGHATVIGDPPTAPSEDPLPVPYLAVPREGWVLDHINS